MAVKLKEKGFKEECIATYDIENKDFDFNNYILRVAHQKNITAKDCLRVFNYSSCGFIIDASTIPQVLKWLREEKKLHIEVMFIRPLHNRAKYYITDVDGSRGDFMDVADEHYETWEQAALAGIEYVLDNLI